jgi:hypothetical protein
MTHRHALPLRLLFAFAASTIVSLVTRVDAQEAAEEARSAPLDRALPMSPNVTTGTLGNGLKYYVRANSEPENRAFFRLVVNVGSLAEEADELGVAHFLEHLAFNGTENFEKNELIAQLEAIGMRIGPGLNARTSFDETVYLLSVPTDAPEHLATPGRVTPNACRSARPRASPPSVERSSASFIASGIVPTSWPSWPSAISTPLASNG